MATEVLIHVSGSQAEHHAHDGMATQMISGKLIGSYIWCGHWPRSNFCISCNVACGARPHFTKMSGTYLGFLGTSANPPLKCYFFWEDWNIRICHLEGLLLTLLWCCSLTGTCMIWRQDIKLSWLAWWWVNINCLVVGSEHWQHHQRLETRRKILVSP